MRLTSARVAEIAEALQGLTNGQLGHYYVRHDTDGLVYVGSDRWERVFRGRRATVDMASYLMGMIASICINMHRTTIPAHLYDLHEAVRWAARWRAYDLGLDDARSWIITQTKICR